MKPIATEEDRQRTVGIFVDGCYEGKIKVEKFEPMIAYLNGNHVNILYGKLQKTKIVEEWSVKLQRNAYVAYYGASDAQLYFEWLMSAVRGLENVTEEVVNEAYRQLDKFILVLRNVIQKDDRITLTKPSDWFSKLADFEQEIRQELTESLTEMKRTQEGVEHTVNSVEDSIAEIGNTLDKRTKEMTETNTQLLQWMKKYSPILDGIDKEYHMVIKGKGKNID